MNCPGGLSMHVDMTAFVSCFHFIDYQVFRLSAFIMFSFVC